MTPPKVTPLAPKQIREFLGGKRLPDIVEQNITPPRVPVNVKKWGKLGLAFADKTCIIVLHPSAVGGPKTALRGTADGLFLARVWCDTS